MMRPKLLLIFSLSFCSLNTMKAQTGNTGIGTTSPATKLDVNGAITNREGTAIAVSGTAATIPDLAFSQYRLTGTPISAFTITGPTTSNGSLALVAGARMILVNTTTQIGTLNGQPIQPGSAQEFAYTGGAWIATNGGARPDYDWMKTGNNFPAAPADTVNSIYHLGQVGVGTNNSLYTLHVQAMADNSNILGNNIVAMFNPLSGGADPGSAAAIALNSGRAVFGYDVDGTTGKYVYLRGNQSTDIRLQVIDANSVLYDKPLYIQGSGGGVGFIGINNDAPQSRLDVRGTTKILADSIVQTGNLWNGTSNLNGFEVTTTSTGDGWVGIQRAGTGSPLLLGKPAGTVSGSSFLACYVGGAGVGGLRYNGSGIDYLTTSDFRLKENIQATQYGLSTVNAMQVYDYNFRADQQKAIFTGLMAQEVYNLYPQAVQVGGADAVTDPWQVDYSKLTPVLIKAVQELNTKVEALKQALQEKDRQLAAGKAREDMVEQLAEEVKQLKQLINNNRRNKKLK